MCYLALKAHLFESTKFKAEVPQNEHQEVAYSAENLKDFFSTDAE